ncbi:MAG: hypothetical protein IPM85_01340 [Chitinophagaceae bacterium]|nr:hypothetical protein [Chitinophagaceae bacterium]
MKKDNLVSRKFCFLLYYFLVHLFLYQAVKQAKNIESKHFISVRSLIERQVAHVDTSLFSIIKITVADSVHSDTTYIPREGFRKEAKDFLEIPDLSDPAVASRYTEANSFDSLIRKVIITYSPINSKNDEIQKQELLVSPDIIVDSSNKVTNIIINRIKKNRDGYFGQQMLWNIDKSFVITTTTQKPNEREKVIITKVIWNDGTLQ